MNKQTLMYIGIGIVVFLAMYMMFKNVGGVKKKPDNRPVEDSDFETEKETSEEVVDEPECDVTVGEFKTIEFDELTKANIGDNNNLVLAIRKELSDKGYNVKKTGGFDCYLAEEIYQAYGINPEEGITLSDI